MLDAMRAAWSSDGLGVESEREAFRAVARQFPEPTGVDEQRIELGGVPTHLTSPATSAATPGRVILYFHGGAFLIGAPDIYRYQSAKLAATAETSVYNVDYRLAPEHPFPAAPEDALAAYLGLLDSGVDASNIVVAGDSAGGNLALGLAMQLRDQSQPQPAGIVAISPWVDLTCSGESMVTNANERHLAQREGLLGAAGVYLAGADPNLPLASPLAGELAGLPPTLIQTGSLETLLDDSLELEQRMNAAGSPARLTIYSGMVHEWHLLSALLEPQEQLAGAERAFVEIATFVEELIPA